MKVYKIRDKDTGLYTEGGRYATANFNENGKIWNSLGSLLKFIKYFMNDQFLYHFSEVTLENFYLKKDGKPLPI